MTRVLGALLLVLVLAGCGGGDDDYRDELPPIDRQLVRLGEDVETALREAGESGDAAIAARFAGFARRLARLRERLGDLDPPSDLQGEHDRLVGAIEPVHGALARIADAARGGDAVAARDAATELVAQGAELEQARAALARAARR
jgi:hypothetical protein